MACLLGYSRVSGKIESQGTGPAHLIDVLFARRVLVAPNYNSGLKFRNRRFGTVRRTPSPRPLMGRSILPLDI